MTHKELCDRARRWLSGSRRCEPVFSDIASCAEIPDAIGWSSTWAWHGSTVVECKASRSDFYADTRKYVGYRDEAAKWNIPVKRVTQQRAEVLGWTLVQLPRMGDFRYFMCERESGITEDLVEKHAPDHGLIYIEGRRAKIARPAVRRDSAMIDKDGEIRYLRFAIINRKPAFHAFDELAIPLNTLEGQIKLGARDIIAGEAFGDMVR